ARNDLGLVNSRLELRVNARGNPGWVLKNPPLSRSSRTSCDFGRDAMASLATSLIPDQIRPSGLAGLFGLFSGLCAIFAACATLIDGHDEFTRSRWPVVSAIVERADVVAARRAPDDGGGMSWKLSARVRYEASGKARTAVLTSRTAYSEKEAALLRSW